MKRTVHLIAAVLATLMIATFFLCTVLVELLGSADAVATVKRLIVIPGLFILVPAIATTGASGFALSKSRHGRLIDSKKKRMPFIAANGLLVLIPCAIFLDLLASKGSFGTRFYLVQGLELIAGATNLALMGLNLRDGLQLTGRVRPNKPLNTDAPPERRPS
ncbi:MAG TPA: hypothetical protein VFM04_04120 [Candidatus Methylomirabilis sp.]|nr:hypothetical protein [Candidatus Methylomirabilis sp.]